ncbi:MAG: hypothetical protein V3W31_02360 [Thermodesulfobacteriota bacterium]
MSLFLAIGVLALTVGVLFLVSPDKLRELNEGCSRLVANLEDGAFTYRMGVGLSLIIASLLFFFVAYYIAAKG